MQCSGRVAERVAVQTAGGMEGKETANSVPGRSTRLGRTLRLLLLLLGWQRQIDTGMRTGGREGMRVRMINTQPRHLLTLTVPVDSPPAPPRRPAARSAAPPSPPLRCLCSAPPSGAITRCCRSASRRCCSDCRRESSCSPPWSQPRLRVSSKSMQSRCSAQADPSGQKGGEGRGRTGRTPL